MKMHEGWDFDDKDALIKHITEHLEEMKYDERSIEYIKGWFSGIRSVFDILNDEEWDDLFEDFECKYTGTTMYGNKR